MSIPFNPASATTNTANTNVKRDASGNFSAGTVTAALTGAASGNPPKADILLHTAQHVVTGYNAASNTDAARGTALRSALTASVSGDLVEILSPGIFDTGSTLCNLPAGVIVKGRGRETTRIKNSGSSLGSCNFELHNGSVVEGIWFDCYVGDGTFRFPIGCTFSGNNNVEAWIRDCKVTGESDGIYASCSNIILHLDHTIIHTEYDAVAGLGSNLTDQTFYFRDCDITIDLTSTATIGVGGDSHDTSHGGSCINLNAGLCYVENCHLTAIGKSATNETRGIQVNANTGPTGTVYLTGGTIHTYGSSTANHDLSVTGANGKIYVRGGIGSGSNGNYATDASGSFIEPNTAVEIGMATSVVPGYLNPVEKGMLDGLAWHPPVRAVATTNITRSGTQTIDGVALGVGDRVLLTGQTSADQNGAFVVASGAWTRVADFTDAYTNNNVQYITFLVGEGTVNAQTVWMLTNTAGYFLGDFGDNLTFTRISGGGFAKHLQGSTSAPTIAANGGAGTSPTIAIAGTDLAGKITLTTGTTPSNTTTICTVTFNSAYASAPYVTFSPANASSAALAALTPYVSSSTTTFTLTSNAVGLAGSTQYIWHYEIIQ